MGKRRWWGLVAVALLLGLAVGRIAYHATAQTTSLTVAEIFNLVYDEATQSLNTIDQAVAQGVQRTVAEITNLVFVQGAAGPYLRTTSGAGVPGGPPSGPAGGVLNETYPNPGLTDVGTAGTCGEAWAVCQPTFDADGRETAWTDVPIVPPAGGISDAMLADTAVTPGTCGSDVATCVQTVNAKGRLTAATTTPIPGLPALVEELPAEPCTLGATVTLPNATYCRCGTGLTWSCNEPSGDASTILTPGITYNANGLEGTRYDVLVLNGTCVLGSHSRIALTAGASGVTCPLPDAALPTTRSDYWIDIMDANLVSVLPFSTQLLDGVNQVSAAVKGPRALIHLRRLSDTAWESVVSAPLGLGVPSTSLCVASGGNINTSSSGSGTWIAHTLTCTLPDTARITTETVVEVCAGWRIVTGADAPTFKHRFVANSTVLWEASAAFTLANNIPGHTARECYQLIGTAPPGVAANVYATVQGGISDSQYAGLSSIIGDPVALNTTGAVILSLETFWTAPETGPNSVQLLTLDVKGARFAQ